jgi:hypothetical protein
MRQRARLLLYWPHMDVDIAHTAASCEECVSQLPFLPAEPLQHHEPATQPFEFLHTDLSEVEGRLFLVIVDHKKRAGNVWAGKTWAGTSCNQFI